MTKTQIRARIAGAAAEIGAAAWDACANPVARADPHPFTRYDFFAALEETGCASPRTGWQPVHLVIERDGGIAGILPLYLKSHSQGEYVFDWGWAEAFERAGGDYYPKLQASVPFTPATGRRLLIAKDAPQEETANALLAAGAAAVKELDGSSLHVTFMTEAEWRAAGALGFLQRTDKQFHWRNRGYTSFNEFLSDLSSSKRKNLRKERAAVAAENIEFDWLTGRDITEAHWDQFFAFYMETGSRKWGTPYLSRTFFSQLGARMGEQVLLVMARRERRYIAGALNLFGEGVLFGRNWGACEYVPFLHFETCYYQAIEFAIARGLAKVEAGAQGEHKLLRGYLPEPTYSAHFIAHPGLRRAVAAFLSQEREAVAQEIEGLAELAPFRKNG
ncbi:MAG: GNAT family N-acetyltransferase [Alphaproteobacteria bacterium]|nr:GNAT family N-acetyltransferase [Alphaproteobacteria bacterium]MBU6472591.1 GNAT family N-acetyltransferase [Alphaproteobacteria bacterium]MDE2012726.1 N-acetyltransferase [Alphaproteobacteria bacterium]MDE2072050.1 N-acetyltransferase [Alphaproteobacteria bacterium]MDE2352484.1 N-acetyltransferase [Alphaproteobacteria bacterium]